MNKAELIDAVAAKTGQSKSDAGAAVEAVFDNIRDAMKSGDTVSLVGFGSFQSAIVQLGLDATRELGKKSKLQLPGHPNSKPVSNLRMLLTDRA